MAFGEVTLGGGRYCIFGWFWCEGNHVVERIRLHTCQYSRNHQADDISRAVAGDATAGGVAGVDIRRWLDTTRQARVPIGCGEAAIPWEKEYSRELIGMKEKVG